MLFNNTTKNIGFILTSITFSSSILGFFISLIVIILIVHYWYFNRLNHKRKIILILSLTVYVYYFIVMLMFISINIQTLLGDIYGIDFSSSWCIFIGYLINTFFAALNLSFVNQAIFRLCRVVYPQYRCFRSTSLYLILPFIQLVLVCILMSPLLKWNGIEYLSNEYYCYIQVTSLRDAIWTGISCINIPVSIVFFIYIRLIIFIKYQSQNQTIIVQRRQNRDIIIIYRILIIIGAFLIASIPFLSLVLIEIITNVEQPLALRITWFSVLPTAAAMTVALVLSTPELKRIVLWRFRRNRIVPVNVPTAHPIPTRIWNNAYINTATIDS